MLGDILQIIDFLFFPVKADKHNVAEETGKKKLWNKKGKLNQMNQNI